MKAIAISLLLLLIGALPGRAQLSASVASSVRNAAAGQRLFFSGTLTNSGTGQLFLNNIAFSGTVAGAVVAGSNAFYSNVPGILCSGESYIGPLFCLVLSSTAPAADYAGSISVQGGTDIFGLSDLADVSFTVLSPAVTVVATGSAAEDGPVSGAFTITRTGGAEIPLPVAYSIGGSGVNGADYQAIAASGTIPAGSSTTTLLITPIPNDIPEPDPTVTLTLLSSTSYDIGASSFDTVTIQVKPVNAWRYAMFGALANTAQASDTASWSGAGIPNLIAFALNMDPFNLNPGLLPSAGSSSNDLTLTYIPNGAATDLTYSVQASSDLVHWSTTNIQPASNPPTAPPGSVTYRYNVPISSGSSVFMRLNVTRTDD
jgi:hypothetical protein